MCVYFSTYLCVQVLQAWSKIRSSTGKFPTRVDTGHEGEDLPELSVAEKSVIAPVQPVVTVTKNYMAQMKLRQESITLTQDPDQTWACVLPRTDLNQSHILIEQPIVTKANDTSWQSALSYALLGTVTYLTFLACWLLALASNRFVVM
jgi:hypothetical protein